MSAVLAEISSIGHHIDTTELNANALRAGSSSSSSWTGRA
jgi:hypothetical protein